MGKIVFMLSKEYAKIVYSALERFNIESIPHATQDWKISEQLSIDEAVQVLKTHNLECIPVESLSNEFM